jgi:uncharacterized protein (DUF1697 family)
VLSARLGLPEVRTVLQTDNLVFRVWGRTADHLERFLVRTAAEWGAIIAANPFPAEAERDPAHLVLMCLKASPAVEQVAVLQAALRGREVIPAGRRQDIRRPLTPSRATPSDGRKEICGS